MGCYGIRARRGEPVRTYTFEDVIQATVLLDEEAGIWLMFYHADGSYGLRTAPLIRRLDPGPVGSGTP